MLFSALLQKIKYSAPVLDCEIDHVTNDSRQAKSDSLFVCIKGYATDGHLFAKKAYDNGCRAFVCERAVDLPSDASIVVLSDTRSALALLSCELYGNPSRELTVIGITGTKGKTTTALMIKQLLDVSGLPCGYVGSNGVIYGDTRIDATNTTPESCKLQAYMRDMISSGMKAVVMEVSSQALKQSRVLGIDFDLTLFSNLSPDHIGPGEHDSFEDYFQTKKRLFDDFECRAVVANADDPYTEKMLADCRSPKIFYSINAPSDYKAKDVELYRTKDFLGMRFTCIHGDCSTPCSLSIPGEFNVYNALSCIAVASALGISRDFASKTLADMHIEGRFEVLCAENGACFVIDYAHNGVSLEASLKALKKYEPSRLICLYGSVGCRTQIRRTQMGAVASRLADFSILTSDNPATENPMDIINEIAEQYRDPESYVAIPNRKEAIEYAFRSSREGDIILLAGKGHERYQLVGNSKLYFCEREIIEDCMRKIKYV